MTVKTFKFRDGFKARPKISAEECHQELEHVRKLNDGTITAPALVQACKPKDHKLHDYFEWRDKVAGSRWREQQARHLIGSIVVTYDQHKAVREYQNVTVEYQPGPDDGKIEQVRAYVSTEEALADPVMRTQILKRALDESKSWRNRYSSLQELARVFDAIDAAAEHLGEAA